MSHKSLGQSTERQVGASATSIDPSALIALMQAGGPAFHGLRQKVVLKHGSHTIAFFVLCSYSPRASNTKFRPIFRPRFFSSSRSTPREG
jgi:hypothetical protein